MESHCQCLGLFCNPFDRRVSSAGHARSASASESSGASETCAVVLAVNPSPGISRVDSPSCVSSHHIHSASEGSPVLDRAVPAALLEPMLITVEADSAKGQEGEVHIMHVVPQQLDQPLASCSSQDVDLIEIHSAPHGSYAAAGSVGLAQQDFSSGQVARSSGQAGQNCIHGQLVGSSSQGGQDCIRGQQSGHSGQDRQRDVRGQQAGSSGHTEQGYGVVDRLRAAVFSRGFEPCPGYSDHAASCAGPYEQQQNAVRSSHGSLASEKISGHGPEAIVPRCHEPEAGVFHTQSNPWL